MKSSRVLGLLVLLLLSQLLAGQTIVSTTPQSKRPVLEEFGGMYCVYCPYGHQIVDNLQDEYGDELVVLNYQTGIYAVPIGDDPDLRSPIGQVIDDQTGLTGYPAGTVNRHVFSGYEQGDPGTTALSRGDWGTAVDIISNQPAPVNIAAEATLNLATRELELYIEYYYTGNAAGGSNRLNVAILQNNILAPQLGGGLGNYYPHQHVVRDMITGQWGHVIETTEAGTFGSLTYELTLPLDYSGIWVDPVNIELAIFIAEGHQEILNGISVQPEIVTDHADDVHLLAIMGPESICEDDVAVDINFRNDGNQPLNTVMIEYGIIGGDSNMMEWSGTLAPLTSTTVALSPIAPAWGTAENELYVILHEPNEQADPTEQNNERLHRVNIAPTVPSLDLELLLRTDNFGYELYWEIIDDNGTVHASGGNEVVAGTNGGAQIAMPTDPGAYPNNWFTVEHISLPYDGCYTLRVVDDFADGLCCYYGNGFFRLRVPGQPVFINGGEFGAVDERLFAVNPFATSTTEIATASAPILYPNPLRSGQDVKVDGQETELLSWALWSTGGQQLKAGQSCDGTIPTGELPAGFYWVELSDGLSRWNLPLIIQP